VRSPLRPTPNGALKSFFASLAHFLWNGGKHETTTPGGQAPIDPTLTSFDQF
jgi:hypothetical protein